MRAASAAALAASVAMPAAGQTAGTTERVSVATGGAQADSTSFGSSVSAGGRFVAFDSSAGNLVPGDTNGNSDIFVRDRQTGTTERVSVGPAGVQADAGCFAPAITPDGRFVAFGCRGTGLAPGAVGENIYVHDRRAGRTEQISVGARGVQPVGDSFGTAISAGGRFVAFASGALNLVSGDTNGQTDVFVRDRLAGTTERVSVGPGGAQANRDSSYVSISAGGRYVAFTSEASNLVPGDTNGKEDIFVRDRRTGRTERVSVGPGSAQANDFSEGQAISADGRFVAFTSEAGNLVPGDTNRALDVFVRDRLTGTTDRVNVGPGGVQAVGESGFAPAISAGGRYVVFLSSASNLVPGDTNNQTDVFVRDRRTGRTERVNLGPGGVQANVGSGAPPAISPGGSFVTFESFASNLVPGDTNGTYDVFVRIRR